MGNQQSAGGGKQEDIVFTVDGGSLAPHGLYSNHDYDIRVVKKLIAERKLGPFYKGLEQEPLEAERTTDGVQPAAALPPILSSSSLAIPVPVKSAEISRSEQIPTPNLPLTVTSASAPEQSILEANLPPPRDSDIDSLRSRRPSTTDNASVYSFKGKRTLSHSSSSSHMKQFHFRNKSTSHQKPPHDIYANIPSEELYRGAVECPICFLYYPRNTNYTRCCDQPICTECFVQIKRPEATMEPAECPYCCETHFGITYQAPPAIPISQLGASSPTLPNGEFTSGSPKKSDRSSFSTPSLFFNSMERGNSPPPIGSPTDSKFGSFVPGRSFEPKQRRKSALSHQSTLVVTTDDIRPDWQRKQQQLILQRDIQQRRMSIMEAAMLSRGLMSHRLGQGPSRSGEIPPSGNFFLESVVRDNIIERGVDRTNNRRGLGAGLEYLSALQNVGADLEDLMLLEAMRRSLIDSSTGNETASPNETEEAQSTLPPLPARVDEESLS
ncbi:SNF1-interacting protein [Nowakowskiella sp. JEL0078]|nr:SNF1-interacting protein [Nowakowskiella sp. JEL0078]